VSPTQDTVGPCAVRDPAHARTHLAREPGDPAAVCYTRGRPHREVDRRTPMTDDRRKSDTAVVPEKSRNAVDASTGDATEGRAVAKGNPPERNVLRTQGRASAPRALERVRQAAQRDRKQRFTALLHHVYDVARLRAAYLALKRDAAAGVAGATWQSYGHALEANLQDLSGRLKRGASRAKPVRRAYIPKADGRPRPLGVPALALPRRVRDRFARFGRTLHPDKTRLIEFGRSADQNRRGRGEGKPETFNFLGFTHSCAKTRQGWFTVLRQTMRTRWQAKLRAVKAELRQRVHQSVAEQGAYLRAVILGHNRSYGVPMNGHALSAFREAMVRLWWRVLRRGSQGNHLTWRRLGAYAARWLPTPRICHPHPRGRFAVTTQGKSRMR
jgi:hypothetical protein